MRITRISPDAHRLTRLELVNAFLVREPDGFTLVDTMIGGSGERIVAAARSLGAPIRRILLTHAHSDHVGSVDELVRHLPEVVVAASARALPLLRRPPDRTVRAGEPPSRIRGGLSGIDAAVTRLVEDGDHVGSLRCIRTPGHSPDHVSFLDERDGTLYAGDALVGVGRLSVPGWTPWYFPLPTLATWSRPLALDSARALLAHPVRRFACGHGPVREGGTAVLSAALARAR